MVRNKQGISTIWGTRIVRSSMDLKAVISNSPADTVLDPFVVVAGQGFLCWLAPAYQTLNAGDICRKVVVFNDNILIACVSVRFTVL